MKDNARPPGTYDDKGRRLDKIPTPDPAELEAFEKNRVIQVNAVPQQIYLTAEALRQNDYVASDTQFVLRVSWTQPAVEKYEYIYLYTHAAPEIGQPAGDPYTWEYATAQPKGKGGEEASYLFWANGFQGTPEYLSGAGAAYVRYMPATGTYVVVARASLRADRSDWMGNVLRDKPSWGALTLNRIFLPGSHDSGTFNMVDVGIPNVYNQTQARNFLEQLKAGVRWLDFRVGYYPAYENGKEGPFFCVHAEYGSWSAVSTALNVIEQWMLGHPKELVFLNFKFEGPDAAGKVWKVNGETHWIDALKTRVLQMAYDTFQPLGVLPRDRHAGMTVNGMAQASCRCVIATSASYAPLTAVGGSGTPPGGDPICPGAEYDWFDKYYIDELIPKLTASLSTPRTWMWAAGTVLTPHKYDGNIPWGVYSLTMDAIDKLNGWIRGYADHLNVVPVDFVEASVTLALVEEFNKARA
jgi:hypothetical protein